MTCSRMLFLGVMVGGAALLIPTQPLYAQAAGGAAKAPAAKLRRPHQRPRRQLLPGSQGCSPARQWQPIPVVSPRPLRSSHHQVEVVSSTDRHAARKDEVVLPGTRVDSAAGSGAEVSFNDGTRVFVGKTRRFRCTAFRHRRPPKVQPRSSPRQQHHHGW